MYAVWHDCQKNSRWERQRDTIGHETVTKRSSGKNQVLLYNYCSSIHIMKYWIHFKYVTIMWHIYRIERRKYYNHCAKSRHFPDKYMAMIIDGMDQQKTTLPHFVNHSKVRAYTIFDLEFEGIICDCLVVNFFTWLCKDSLLLISERAVYNLSNNNYKQSVNK